MHNQQQLVLCACNCKQPRPLVDVKGRIRKFIHGHGRRGQKDSQETILKRTGENSSLWKGDDVNYKGLHKWLRKHLPKPDKCQECNLRTPEDVANITGIYNRDFGNWRWYCKKCHNIFDLSIDMSNRVCSKCGSSKTRIQRKDNGTNGRPHWRYSKITGQLICCKCSSKEWNLANKEYLKSYRLSKALLSHIQTAEGNKQYQ